MKRIQILLLDSEPRHSQALFHVLNQENDFSIYTSHSFDMFIEIAQSRPLDFIILDWNLLLPHIGHLKTIIQRSPKIKEPHWLITASQKQIQNQKGLIEEYCSTVFSRPVFTRALIHKIRQTSTSAANAPLEEEPAIPNLSFLATSPRKAFDQESLQGEADKLFQERQLVQKMQEKLREDIVRLADEKKKLDTERNDLINQQERFTREENQLFAAQIKLREERDNLEKEKKLLEQEKKYLKNLRKQVHIEKNLVLKYPHPSSQDPNSGD